MRILILWVGAALAAAVAAALAAIVVFQDPSIFPLAIVVTSVTTCLAGLPAAFWFVRMGWQGLWRSLVAGGLIGSVPVVLVTWPPVLDEPPRLGVVATWQNGLPTLASVEQYAILIGGFAVCGVAGALAFWATLYAGGFSLAVHQRERTWSGRS